MEPYMKIIAFIERIKLVATKAMAQSIRFMTKLFVIVEIVVLNFTRNQLLKSQYKIF